MYIGVSKPRNVTPKASPCSRRALSMNWIGRNSQFRVWTAGRDLRTGGSLTATEDSTIASPSSALCAISHSGNRAGAEALAQGTGSLGPDEDGGIPVEAREPPVRRQR